MIAAANFLHSFMLLEFGACFFYLDVRRGYLNNCSNNSLFLAFPRWCPCKYQWREHRRLYPQTSCWPDQIFGKPANVTIHLLPLGASKMLWSLIMPVEWMNRLLFRITRREAMHHSFGTGYRYSLSVPFVSQGFLKFEHTVNIWSQRTSIAQTSVWEG